MARMQAREIEMYLADLGQQLQQMGVPQPVRLLLIGGAFMLTQLHSRRATNDVDVLLVDVDDPAISHSTRRSKRPCARWQAGTGIFLRRLATGHISLRNSWEQRCQSEQQRFM